MKKSRLLAATAIALALAAGTASVSQAQQTTSDLRGVVTTESGAPIPDAQVTVTNTLTGGRRTLRTDSQGRFRAQNLSVTGTYAISAGGGGFQGERVEDVRLSLGDTTVINFDLSEGGVTDEFVVVAQRSAVGQVTTGPASSFDFENLQTTPAINRDIKDILRQDPRVFIDQSFGQGLQCAGASPRFNSLTVDGIRLNDNFGLNSNGYPTERMPFPFDAISQVAVELAPFDVEYGGFTACNINAVTRSGSNEFHGSAWFDYTSDALNGDSVDGSEFDTGDYDDFRFGATFSGPIIEDKLFFFAAFERTNETAIIGRGPAEAGSIGVGGVSQAQLDEIRDIATGVYDYDPGTLPESYGQDDDKFLARLDWQITNAHRASLTYNYNDGNTLTASDGDPDEYEFFNHYYIKSTELNSISGQIFSDWTDSFSTEARVSYTTNRTDQASIGGTDFGEVQIDTENNGESATIYLGADDSRHSNDLDVDTFNLKLKGDYQLDNHLFSVGYERETVDIFNLFVQHTDGEFRFNSIDDFRNGIADRIYYGNAGGTNNPADGAANFSYTTNTVYGQDTFSFDAVDLTLTGGLRYDWYESGDIPSLNPGFAERNGFDNTSTFDGKGLLQPRFGLDWQATERLMIRAGAGLYSGGNPNVWLANSYQNDGVTTIQQRIDDVDFSAVTWVEDEDGAGRPLYGVPEELYDAVASGSADTSVNAVDPDFNVPSQWKFGLGATYDVDPNHQVMLDLLYTKDRDAATIVDATLEQIDTAPDGRPIYRRIDRSDPDCATNPATCTSRGFDNDFLLTNNDGGRQLVLSAAVRGDYEWDRLRADWAAAYAYTDATDRNPMTSSVAFSNYVNMATADPNDPASATSNYEVPHRFTIRGGLGGEFFEDLETRFDIFGVISQSRPYSFIFSGGGDLFGDTLDNRHLAYIPSGASDPNVLYAPGFDTSAFLDMIEELGLGKYAGEISERNAFQSDWYNQWDLRVEQEIPSVFEGHKAKMFFVIRNLGNLIDDSWGVVNQAGFPGSVRLAEVNEEVGCAQCAPGSAFGPNGEYIYTDYNEVTKQSLQSPVTSASVWQIRMGLRYEF